MAGTRRQESGYGKGSIFGPTNRCSSLQLVMGRTWRNSPFEGGPAGEACPGLRVYSQEKLECSHSPALGVQWLGADSCERVDILPGSFLAGRGSPGMWSPTQTAYLSELWACGGKSNNTAIKLGKDVLPMGALHFPGPLWWPQDDVLQEVRGSWTMHDGSHHVISTVKSIGNILDFKQHAMLRLK